MSHIVFDVWKILYFEIFSKSDVLHIIHHMLEDGNIKNDDEEHRGRLVGSSIPFSHPFSHPGPVYLAYIADTASSSMTFS